MHLDTVMTMVDRDAFTIYPDVRAGLTAYELRPGGARHHRRARGRRDRRASPPRSTCPQLRLFETGGDRYEAEREQWDDGNNVLAVAPGRRRRLRAQRRHQHRAAPRGHRGHHDRRLRARPRPRRPALHVLPDHPRRRPRRSVVMTTVTDMRGRSFLTLAEFSAEELTLPARPGRAAQGRSPRGTRGAAARRKDDRADLREGLDAHALRVRGRRVPPGRARDVPRPDRVAHRPQGDGQGHGARARPHVRRDRVPRVRRVGRRRARRAGPACPSTTGSPTSGTRRRSWPTS